MPAAFSYAVVRVVPEVEREEFVNAGVVLFCEAQDFLAAKVELDAKLLLALCSRVDLDLVNRHLEALLRVCRGGEDAGLIGALPVRERWSWVVAPRSTIVQTSAPHAGLCDHPGETLERLLNRVVRRPF